MTLKGQITDFTYREYERFIKYAKKIAPIYSLRDWNRDNGIILRHDVDLSVRSAHDLSKLEKKLGVSSTYFIMASNYHYNALFPTNSRMLLEMANDGFEIGLHFDPSIYGDIKPGELLKKVKMECAILESATGEPVTSISLHNPSLNGMYPMFKGYKNAYSKEIFSDDNYMSDSCMGFRGKDPYDFVKKAEKIPIQIVFHPAHWSEEGRDYVGYFTDHVLGIIDEIDESMRVNTKYNELMGNAKLRTKVGRAINDRNQD